MITHLQLVDELLIASIVAIWLGTIRWAYTDARARIRSRVLVRCATLITALPVVGLLIYLMLRPPDRLSELRQLEMEMRTLEMRLRRLGRRRCPKCGHELLSDFVRCPRCTAALRHPCVRCHRPLELSWVTCPFCDADQDDPEAAAEGDAGSTATDSRPSPPADPRGRTAGRPLAGGSGAPGRAAVPPPGSNGRPGPRGVARIDGVAASVPRRLSGPRRVSGPSEFSEPGGVSGPPGGVSRPDGLSRPRGVARPGGLSRPGGVAGPPGVSGANASGELRPMAGGRRTAADGAGRQSESRTRTGGQAGGGASPVRALERAPGVSRPGSNDAGAATPPAMAPEPESPQPDMPAARRTGPLRALDPAFDD